MNISGFQLLGLGWNLSVRNASAEQSAGAWEKDGCRSWSDARLNSSVFWISYIIIPWDDIIEYDWSFFVFTLWWFSGLPMFFSWKWPWFQGQIIYTYLYISSTNWAIFDCKLLNVQRVTIPNSDQLLRIWLASRRFRHRWPGKNERLRMFDWI